MKYKLIIIAIAVTAFYSCGGDKKVDETATDETAVVETPQEESPAVEEPSNDDFMSRKGIGPIKELKLEAIDEKLVATGQEVFKTKCSACHKISKRVVGPALEGITTRRSPEWIMNMILNPEEMVEKDPDAKALLAEYLSPMANQSLTVEEARSILEYFRTK